MSGDMPRHVAIILDGNGRWAAARHLPRKAGHAQGSKVVEQICEDAYRMGISYLTVYAFSTENWNRPKDEVDALMDLLRSYLKDCIKISTKNNMRVRIIGDRRALAPDIIERIQVLETTSRDNTGLQFQVALNYGGRDELARAVQKIAIEAAAGRQKPEEVNEALIASYLDTRDIPDPDLVIRTSGEQRLSNFLLWQSAYAELYFTPVLWPDFTKEELEKAVIWYQGRDRRYGA